jgi:hypothetical protein
MKSHFHAGPKFCSVAAMALLVVAALGPANWQLRMELGFKIEHFLALFAVTSVMPGLNPAIRSRRSVLCRPPPV